MESIFLCLFIKNTKYIFVFLLTYLYSCIIFWIYFFKFGRAFNSSDVCSFLDSEIIESISFIIEYKYCLLIFIPIIIIIYISKYFKSEFRKIYLIIALCIFINPYMKLFILYTKVLIQEAMNLRIFIQRENLLKESLILLILK